VTGLVTLMALLHMPAPTAAELAAAWASPRYATREAATSRCLLAGRRAYWPVVACFRHRDPEVANRARTIFPAIAFIRVPPIPEPELTCAWYSIWLWPLGELPLVPRFRWSVPAAPFPDTPWLGHVAGQAMPADRPGRRPFGWRWRTQFAVDALVAREQKRWKDRALIWSVSRQTGQVQSHPGVSEPRVFTVAFLDGLVLRGFPPGLAQAWYDRAAAAEAHAKDRVIHPEH
jgi:hypothetical protein